MVLRDYQNARQNKATFQNEWTKLIAEIIYARHEYNKVIDFSKHSLFTGNIGGWQKKVNNDLGIKRSRFCISLTNVP